MGGYILAAATKQSTGSGSASTKPKAQIGRGNRVIAGQPLILRRRVGPLQRPSQRCDSASRMKTPSHQRQRPKYRPLVLRNLTAPAGVGQPWLGSAPSGDPLCAGALSPVSSPLFRAFSQHRLGAQAQQMRINNNQTFQIKSVVRNRPVSAASLIASEMYAYQPEYD